MKLVNKAINHILGVLIIFSVFSPPAAAEAGFTYGAWLPFWKKQPGAREITPHLYSFSQISPFSYEINPDGTLIDKIKIDEGFWPAWLLAVHDLRIKIIPSIAWFDQDGLHKLLSVSSTRNAHIKEIVALAQTRHFDGVDIDYENKKAETKPYFSRFIKDLSVKLHAKKKLLTCTVEPRTPLARRFKKPPAGIEYANDYSVLNAYCDEVRLMAYDQGNIDLVLNEKNVTSSQFYMPVADTAWVKEVIQETIKTISPKKLVLGVPTYGYEYQVTEDYGGPTFKRLRALTYSSTAMLARGAGMTPLRNSAGELSFSYTTSSSIRAASSSEPQVVTSTRFVSLSDASAMNDKIKLAKAFKLKGVIFFKFDGETDPGLWAKLK